MHCRQCFDSNWKSGYCPMDYCELRYKETGKWTKEQSKMTREEASRKLLALDYDTKEGVDYDLKVLEALGLIKFEEEKKVRLPLEIIGDTKDKKLHIAPYIGSANARLIIDRLEAEGYEIVRK